MEEKTDSNSTNSAGRDAVSKAPSLSCRVTVSFSLLPACLYRVSGFVSANGTKPKWQLWHRGGATRKKRNRKRWSGQDCCNPPQSPIGCPTYDFTENPPTSAYAGTSGFYVINIQLCILNWTTLSIVTRLWINNWTHAVVGQFANNEKCHNFLPHDTPYLYDFFFCAT